jgi:hypothetical protein
MSENITISGPGYSVTIKVDVAGDREKFLADAAKVREGIAKAFDQVMNQTNDA